MQINQNIEITRRLIKRFQRILKPRLQKNRAALEHLRYHVPTLILNKKKILLIMINVKIIDHTSML